MKVITVVMPGMFEMKDDLPGGATYRPMPYALGDVCEPCWLTEPASFDDWSAAEDAIVPVGGYGCTHAAVTA